MLLVYKRGDCMRKFFQDVIVEVAYYLEIALSVILATAIIFFSLALFHDLFSMLSVDQNVDKLFQTFLARAMTIAVGIELIKMFSKPSPDTLIEVLLFALARQLVIEHGSVSDYLMGIASVAILFAVRKYLFTHFDESSNIVLRANNKVKNANILARVQLPCQPNETLGDLLVRHLNDEEKDVAIGSVVYINNVALRVDSMHDGLVTRVEIIRSLH